MVLLKGHGPDGFVFYTNEQSAKGEQLAANPQRRTAVPLEVAAAPGPHRGRGRARGRRRGRRLFRHAARAIRSSAPGRRTSRAPLDSRDDVRAALRRDEAALRRPGRAAPAALGRLSRGPRADRILERPRRTGCTSGGCSRATATAGPKGCSTRDRPPQARRRAFALTRPRAALASVALALILLVAKAGRRMRPIRRRCSAALADTALDVIASLVDACSACGSPPCPPTATIASGTARPRRWSRSPRSSLITVSAIGIALARGRSADARRADRGDGPRHRRLARSRSP